MSDFEQLAILRDHVSRLDLGQWQEVGGLVLAVHSAGVRMGTFGNPLVDYEPELAALTLNAWQFEQARRQTLAVLDFLLGETSNALANPERVSE